MINRHLLLLIMIACAFTATAQSWETEVTQTPEGYNGIQAVEDLHGDIAVCGIQGITIGNFPFFLCKLDSAGNHLWHRNYYAGIATSYECKGIVEVDSSGYLLYGESAVNGAAQYDYFVIRTNYDGDTLWTKSWGTQAYREGLVRCLKAADGGYYFLGYRYVESCGDSGDVGITRIIKTDSLCNPQWEKCYQYGTYDFGSEGRGLVVTPNGELLISGFVHNDNGGFPFLLKLSSLGDTLMYRTYMPISHGQGNTVAIDSQGCYYLSAVVGDSLVSGYYAVLIKTDSLGNQIWIKIEGQPDEQNSFLDISFNHQNKLHAAGGFCSSGNCIGLIARYGVLGNRLWCRAIDRCSPFYRVSNTQDGSVLVASRFNGSGKLYVAKIDSNGNVPDGYIDPLEVPAINKGDVNNTDWLLYPNPSAGEVNVGLLGKFFNNDTYSVSVYDAFGRLAISEKIPRGFFNLNLQIEELPKGCYQVVLFNNDMRVSTKKLSVL